MFADLDDLDRSSHVHQRLERKWLGSLSIPFSSLYHNTRIEGTFRLHSPPVLLGYERSSTVDSASMGRMLHTISLCAFILLVTTH